MTCAYAVRGALKKFSGVESVDVLLNQGLATVKLKPGNTIEPQQFWQAVRKNGFTTKDTHVIVRGEIFSTAGKPMLKVSVTNQIYALTGLDGVKRKMGEIVIVDGGITPPKDLTSPAPLQVREVRAEK